MDAEVVDAQFAKRSQNKANYYRRLEEYDKSGQSTLEEGIFNKKGHMKKVKKAYARARESEALLKSISEFTVSGMKYGDLRDLMFNDGILDLFMSNTILHSIQAVTPILQFMLDNRMLNKADSNYGDGIKATPMTSLMDMFFSYAKIDGFDWKQVFNDMPSQQAFAQSFLEYMAFNFLPQWNAVERLMSGFLTVRDKNSRTLLEEGIKKLIYMFKPTAWIKFMMKYLRFPRMTFKLIDYSNANRKQRVQLDIYRSNLGIPSAAEKDSILKTWIGLWGKISGMSDADLQKNIDLLKPLLEKAQYEAKFTGELGYLDQLQKIWTAFGDERKKRLDA